MERKIKRHYSREVYFDQLLKKLSDNKDINPKIVEQDKVKAERLRKKPFKDVFWKIFKTNFREI